MTALLTRDITTTCPHCRETFPCATNIYDNSEPKAGHSAMLCIKCGAWSMFTRGGKLRKPRPDEQEVLRTEPKYVDVRRAWLLTVACKPTRRAN